MSHSLIARILVLLGIWIIALLPLLFMSVPERPESAHSMAAPGAFPMRVLDRKD